ncbi:MAG TPA: hypothetical protein VGV88_10980 [Candidatus Dormibacteraeota bacterium]|nr:hypothetical protein [Candidatus Dormibacteraeota bacterium]
MTPGQLQANQDDTLTVSISADKYEEIHLHGYDKHFFPSPGQPATVTFPADKTGNFVIEIEATSTPLGLLDVKPRGGFLGLGQPPDQSSTTIHAAAAGTQIKLATSASYNFVAEIGGLQAMYTEAQASSQHPKTGEVMFGGTMTMPSDTGNVSPDWHHLEVHVFDKKTGNVVKTVNPVLTVKNDTTGQTQQVPIVVMQGIVEGPGDYHYGNNVFLPKGEYTVTVVIGNETASFDFNI